MERSVGKEKDDRKRIVADARITPSTRWAAEARRNVRKKSIAGHELVEGFDLTFGLIEAVSEAKRIHRGLHLDEIVGRTDVKFEGIVEAGFTVRRDRKVGEACDAKAGIGDRIVNPRGNSIAKALPNPVDLLAHAERHIDEEDHIGGADSGLELE